MATNTQPVSDLAVIPGEYLLEVVQEAGITQADLARKMGRPPQAINEIIKGEKAITPDTALQLEQVIGVPAHIWTGLESEYQLVKARHQAARQDAEEAALLRGLSYPALAHFAGLPPAHRAADKVRELRRFLGLASLNNLDGVNALRPAYRRSQKMELSPLALAVWLRKAELVAAHVDTAPFDPARLKACGGRIRAMTRQSPQDFEPALRALLADCGVAFLVQPHLARTGVHGATFWITPAKAVLVMTLRYKWADAFWFSLFHEIGHLVLHGKTRTFLENRATDPDARSLEAEADDFASHHLIPPAEMGAFAHSGTISKRALAEFADRVGIDPGIVVGRLHHDGRLPRSWMNGLRTQFDFGKQG
jgi:HTH-type transcriptional regulator/antitoxin HigA